VQISKHIATCCLAIPLFAAILLTGCYSSSLNRLADWDSVVRERPALIAIGPLADTIDCDDEALYLQDYIAQRNLFLDVVLADPDRPRAYHSGNAVITGSIRPIQQKARSKGLGVFLSVITLGVYPLLGGPYKSEETHVEYKFNVFYADTDVVKAYNYSDVRKTSYGWYRPVTFLETKPGLYTPGWDALLYDLCGELMAQQAKGIE
jgi:hypothetical protein